MFFSLIVILALLSQGLVAYDFCIRNPDSIK